MPFALQTIAGPAAKPLKLGVAAFFIGCCGAIFGFVIDYGPHNPLSLIAFSVVSLSVATGFISVVWGWLTIVRPSKKGPPNE